MIKNGCETGSYLKIRIFGRDQDEAATLISGEKTFLRGFLKAGGSGVIPHPRYVGKSTIVFIYPVSTA
jgi:hypothetical protein